MEIMILVKIGLFLLVIRYGRDEYRKYQDYKRRLAKSGKHVSTVLEKEGKWWRRKILTIRLGITGFAGAIVYFIVAVTLDLPEWTIHGIWIFYGLAMLSAAVYGVMLGITDPSW